MKFKNYLKEAMFEIILGLLVIGVWLVLFQAFRVPVELRVVLISMYILYDFVVLVYKYFRKKSFYDELLQNTERLDKKYLVLETIRQPAAYEEKLLYDIMYEINKSMCENVNDYRCKMDDFKDYIEMWVHEVKLPLASLELMCHNNKQTLESKVLKQLRRLDQYVDQVLYYIRSEHKEKDYLITEVDLKKCITETALKNREDMQEYNMDLSVDDICFTVMTDGKWLTFILNQLFNNCIKYRDENKQSYISIFAENLPDRVKLHIKDNGIGICSSDLLQVWDKSFTGKNGRIHAKSTGMGLYIVKSLCDNLGHRVEIESKENEYTEVILSFAKNDYYFMG